MDDDFYQLAEKAQEGALAWLEDLVARGEVKGLGVAVDVFCRVTGVLCREALPEDDFDVEVVRRTAEDSIRRRAMIFGKPCFLDEPPYA